MIEQCQKCKKYEHVCSCPGGKPTIKLTKRQLEVVKLITVGIRNKQAGKQLGITEKTVEYHREEAMRKLKIHSIALLTHFALAKGWTKNAFSKS